MSLQVVPLHEHPHYTLKCAQLITDEWDGSTKARVHLLEHSCPEFPISLVLLKDDAVIGHCRLMRMPDVQDACFVDLLVIKKASRRNGYGSSLMAKAEEYTKNVLGFKTIYLATKGQEQFYSKLGYSRCRSVMSLQEDCPTTNASSTQSVTATTTNYDQDIAVHMTKSL